MGNVSARAVQSQQISSVRFACTTDGCDTASGQRLHNRRWMIGLRAQYFDNDARVI